MSFGRHEACKKPSTNVPKYNYLRRKSSKIELDDTKKQLIELSKNLAELKIEIGIKNDRIKEQAAMMEVQQQRIEKNSTNLAELRAELGLKNDRINEQTSLMDVQQQRIQEITTNLTGLKIDIDLKNDRINKQTGLMEFQQQQIEAICWRSSGSESKRFQEIWIEKMIELMNKPLCWRSSGSQLKNQDMKRKAHM